MSRFRRILTLTRVERRLLLRALFVVTVARIAILVLPFAMARRIVERWTPRVGAAPARTVAWAVTVSSRVVPASNCLVQAVAAQALLVRAGYESRMEIGFRRETPDAFEAHAWVVCEGQVVIGGATAERFTRLSYGGL